MYLTEVVSTVSPTFQVPGAIQLFIYGVGLGLGLATTIAIIPITIKFMKSLL